MYIFKNAEDAVEVVKFITGVDLWKLRTKKERVWCAALVSVWKWEQVEKGIVGFYKNATDCGLCKEFVYSPNPRCTVCPLSEINIKKTGNRCCVNDNGGTVYNEAVNGNTKPLINELRKIVGSFNICSWYSSGNIYHFTFSA